MNEADIFVLLVILASTLLNAAYFIPIVYNAFMKTENVKPSQEHGEAPWPIVLALSLTAAGSIALFLYPDVPLALAEQLVGR
jgi:multicomponent Na+:H+ antiporter subunit D